MVSDRRLSRAARSPSRFVAARSGRLTALAPLGLLVRRAVLIPVSLWAVLALLAGCSESVTTARTPARPGAVAARPAGEPHAPAGPQTAMSGWRGSDAPQPTQPWVIRPFRPQPAEVRALWVKKQTLASPEAIRKLVDDAAAAGFNTIIAQVRARGDAMYLSRFEPKADSLRDQPPDFDPLALLLSQAHAKGLFVHAWLNTFFVANCDYPPEQPGHVCNAHPDWLMVPSQAALELDGTDPSAERYKARLLAHAKANRHAVEGLYLSPAHPAAREHLVNVWMDVVGRYDVDGLHFDFVRYPGPDFDYSSVALQSFRAWLLAKGAAGRIPLAPDAFQMDRLGLTRAYPAQWDEFRREQVTLLVERISRQARTLKPGVILSAAVFPDGDDALKHRYQDWRGWMERGLLDVVCPMAYSTDTAVFAKRIAEARGAANRGRLWAGIGAYRMGPDAALEKIDAARRLGSDGFVLFSYETLGTEIPGGSRRETPVGYLERIKTAWR